MEESNKNNSIPEMNIENKYSEDKPKIPENSTQAQKEMEKTKKEVEKLKNFIVKKYPFVQALGILPPQSIPVFIEEEEIPKEVEKHIHLYMIVSEDKLKEIPKIKQVIIQKIESLKQKIWLQIKTPIDIWEGCIDSKFEITNAIGMAFPLYDKGILSGLRVAEIHKSLVLQKFEKYVVSYVIAGSLVRGDTTKTSDVDVFVIINDTDVKRMPRLELKERLRSIIFQYISEATALAGLKTNVLNVQAYLLTDFWDSVKDANPVIFTFIRDGVPLYDRGTFMPWKALLKMGKLKPSPEAIDMFMSMGDNTIKRAKKALLEIVIGDLYWSVLTPSQALLMLYGLPPPTPKQIVGEMKRVFMTKEKMLEKKYIDILEEIVVKYYKGYEHEKIKDVSGKDVDRLIKNTEDYIKRLGELREQIEKQAQEKTIEQIYKDVFELLKTILGRKSQAVLIEEFEKKLIKTGKLPRNSLRILEKVVDARKEFKKGKSNSHKVDLARKNASILINDLIEYSQRCDLAFMEKGKMMLKFGKGEMAELLTANDKTFLIQGNIIKKLGSKIEITDMNEMVKAIEIQKTKQAVKINPKVFELVKKELGEFEIVL
ncbi:MAG: nucleotidyltransferase domain-containing protein [Nanoarchaeota archaeon]